MNTTDFHITKVMPEEMKRSVLDVEGICPICKSRHTCYYTRYRINNSIWQNYYKCNNCESEWLGNSYRVSDNRRLSSSEESNINHTPHPIIDGFSKILKL